MNFTNSVVGKKWMAIAGLAWFSYIIFHMISLLIFHQGEQSFNSFYQQLNQHSLYQIMVVFLVMLFSFHVVTAVVRQIANNKSKGRGYKKSYPHEIPRVAAWSGASILFIFIIVHVVQLKLFVNDHWYQITVELLSQPLMLAFYLLGVLTLSVHLHHGLSNVLQTLGITQRSYHYLAISISLILFVGFLSILASVAL